MLDIQKNIPRFKVDVLPPRNARHKGVIGCFAVEEIKPMRPAVPQYFGHDHLVFRHPRPHVVVHPHRSANRCKVPVEDLCHILRPGRILDRARPRILSRL